MPLVNAADLSEHGRNAGYRVPTFEISSLDHIVPVIEAAERAAVPAILSFAGDAGRSLAPALAAAVAGARTADVPLVVEARVGPDGEAVAGAIRGGANSILLCPQADTTQDQVEAAMKVGHATGVPLFVARDGAMSTGDRHRHPLQGAGEMLGGEIERGIAASGGRGRAAQAVAACRPWREVEHLIVYNVGPDRDGPFVEQMMARGRAMLGAIPGVRRVFTGRVLRDDARYRYCWLVRFASPAVVASYRDHPEHVAFADTLFRPAAVDRISIDFEAVD